MYSLWKELSNQVKKKAEDINTILNEININNVSIDSNDNNVRNNDTNSTSLKTSINNKINELNNKYIINATESPEFIYYNNKIVNGINNFKKIVSDIYHEKINTINDGNENVNYHNSNSILNDCKIYLSRIVPWKKGDIMVSKIYRKKYGESCPIKLPDNNINQIVYEQILKLNKDKNKIINTVVLQNYNFNWEKKKIQTEEILKQDNNLVMTKDFIVPQYMNEIAFWKSYYFNIDIIYNELADYIYENKQTIFDEYIQAEQEKKSNPNLVHHDLANYADIYDKAENKYAFPDRNNLVTFSYSASSSFIRGFDEAYDESKRLADKSESTELIYTNLTEMKNNKNAILNPKNIDKMEKSESSTCLEKQTKQDSNINNENGIYNDTKVNKIKMDSDNEEVLFHFDEPTKNSSFTNNLENKNCDPNVAPQNETCQTSNTQTDSNKINEKYKEINIDEFNFTDDINFGEDINFDSINKFDAKELEQFEKDLLNA
ncbi:BSD-domain protein, putative [Plasmodium vinckei brucechwatti]|uniref:BSD-domain protein, putative n=1 Tax=Plasmodium vinckei brucechwatti TaxID=119398 RepID=A0A6V7S1I3_PLAVN|nr:BSD-domain protein, putative [Plasmodium vinckei brucechwatti]